ncbi:hypothetical protein B9Z32_00080 [Limnohabitans sp. MMS-10A-178]|nr:hypothetical protein B9Z32_00080 [Limnohabitans sp. MMS-10A-178]
MAINGKFAAQRFTGVQRVAEQLVRELDIIAEAAEITIFLPPGSRHLGLSRIHEKEVGPKGLPLHIWEQLILPQAAKGHLLLNLSGSAPAFFNRQICLMHDAAVFDTPSAYKLAFVFWYRWLYRRISRHSDFVLTVSEFSRIRLMSVLNLKPEKLLVMPNAADHFDNRSITAKELEEYLNKYALSPGKYILAVGSKNPNKNLNGLMQAHASLPTDRLPLVVVGGSNPTVFAPIGPKITSDVIDVGSINDKTLCMLYQGARALVFPSLYEGFGLPPLEAMVMGCPVIASDAGALPETCGDAALYVKPKDVDGIAEAIRRVSVDDLLFAQLSSAGRNRATLFRWSNTAERLATALSQSGLRM